MKPTLVFASLLAAFTLSACETIEGAGKDISTAGKVISSESRKVKSGM